MTSDNSAELDRRLKALLDEGDFNVKPVGSAIYDVSFRGQLREWTVTTRLTETWILLRTYVMRLPESAQIRTTLLQTALEINGDLPLGKLSIEGDSLYLDIEYRTEHLDSSVLGNLLRLVVQVGDDEYPRLFRIASGDTMLKALESSFQVRKPA
ncbi:MAG: hypothetical protein WAJ85_08250 [Candidatus Baltobacteraceae bacterium]|jgi:hypothetical protein